MTEYSKTNLLKLAQDKQYAKMGAHLSLEDQQLILTKAQQLKENIFTFDKTLGYGTLHDSIPARNTRFQCAKK